MTSPEIVWVHPVYLTGYPRFDSLDIGADGSIYTLVSTYSTYEKIGTNQYSYGGTKTSFLIRYNPTDDSGWSQGTVSPDWRAKLNVNPDGSVYEVINFNQPNSWNSDVSITRFNADGSQAWSRQLGGAAQENLTALASAADGAVYVAGSTLSSFDGQSNSGQEDGFLTRFNSDGSKAWTKFVGGAGRDSISYLSAGTDGSIFVSGVKDVTFNASTGNVSGSGFISRYLANGSLAWSRNYGDSGFEASSTLTAGLDGEVYASELNVIDSYGSIFQGSAHLTRYNSDGSKAWSVLFGDGGASVVLKTFCGSNGAIYAMGASWSSSVADLSNTKDASLYFARYNQDGTQAWTQTVAQSDADGSNRGPSSFEFSEEGGALFLTGASTASFTIFGTTVDAGAGAGTEPFFFFKIKIDEPVTGNHAPTGSVLIAKHGQTLTANTTLADADGLGTISYQWQADGKNITGAATSSLALSQDQAGKTITLVASYTDGGGTLERVTSNSVQVANYNTAAAENTTAVTTLALTDALLGTAPKFTLIGADAKLFKISNKGVLTFATAKDYEQPVDANKDGVYEVSVTITNAKTKYAVTQDLTVEVEFVPINGTTGADNLKGTAGWDTLDGQGGDDKLTGGTGLDTFLVTSGHDTILDLNALSKGATGSEILQVSTSAVANAALKAAWAATSDSFNDGTANLTTKGMAVDLSGITHGQGWNVTNSGAGTSITGSQFNDVVTGGSGNDILLGGAGNDLLIGGKGADTLTGGTGADTFRLSGDTKTDHITDFVSGTDRIELDHLLYKALGTGPLAANQFVQGTAATTTTQRIVYDQPTGNLWYDADGSGKGKAVLIGVMENHVQITNTDFWVI